MAVPDWPTTYGYNMFLFPISQWVGGVFYEHTHRLIASGVGLLTVILAVYLLVVEPRRWVKILGLFAGVLVIVQGVLGGLRVTLIKNELGIFHGTVAQTFLVIMGILVLSTSPYYVRADWSRLASVARWRWFGVVVVAAIFIQLAIGASMRHAHAGLAIPDFPLAYGKIWPPTNQAFLEKINAERLEHDQPPTTAGQIHLQMLHRIWAFVIFFLAIAFTRRLMGSGAPRALRGVALVWMLLVICQIGFGAWTVWSNKAADIATAHVFIGATLLLLAGVMTFTLFVGARWESLHRGIDQVSTPE